MIASRFDRLTRSLATASSRRLFLRGLATLGLAGGLVPDVASAKKRKKKPKLNKFGCVNVGGKCRGKDANCCSGLCQGKKPKQGKKDTSRCVAHNELDCPAGADGCEGPPAACGTNGQCYQTTGQASFCAAYAMCFDCKRDADCEPEFGPGAACGAGCAVFCPTGTFCAPPLV